MDSTGKILTVNPEVIIRGNGAFGTFNSNFFHKAIKVVNKGTIEAVNRINMYVSTFENTNGVNDGGILRAGAGSVLDINGLGTLTNSNAGLIEALSNSTVSFTNGAILINNAGGTIELEQGTIDAAAGLDLNGGQLIGSGTFKGPIRNNGGIVAPGVSPGKITIEANYTQGANAVLAIEIGGNTPGTGYDQIRVVGTATLGGTLNIKLINGYRPQIGDVFEIIDPNAVSGSFAQINAEGFGVQANYAAGGITVTVTSVPGQLLNISTRLRVGTGENALIGGFIITGTEAKKVIIRAIGPSLIGQGVADALANPTLDLVNGAGESIAFNDDWKQSQQAEIEASQVAPTNDSESAIVRTLAPGNYTAVVRGSGETSGVGLIEVFDLAQTTQSKLANISSRGFVERGENVLIGGFIIGNSASGASVVVRAIGPSLSSSGVQDALEDPTLELFDGNGTQIDSNDDWKDTHQAEITATGIPPTNDAESALLATLAAGNYTAIVRGKDNTTGVALVEVYNVQ